LSRTNFSIPDLGSRVKKIPDPESASKNFSIFNPKNGFSALGKMIRDVQKIFVHPGSGSSLFIHPGYRISDPGVKKAPDPGSVSATLLIYI
jgi:hypothetical protein